MDLWGDRVLMKASFSTRLYVTLKRFPPLAATMILCPTTKLATSSEVSKTHFVKESLQIGCSLSPLLASGTLTETTSTDFITFETLHVEILWVFRLKKDIKAILFSLKNAAVSTSQTKMMEEKRNTVHLYSNLLFLNTDSTLIHCI